jgi:glycosyltransferase involved in cell wall biosynthesis
MKIRYRAHHLELSGYGKAAAGYIEALRRSLDQSGDRGSLIDVQPVEGFQDDGEQFDVELIHTTPARLGVVNRSVGVRAHVAITTWETEPMPTEYVAMLKEKFDAVVVPSAFCRNLIGDSAHVVPHGFDPSVWVSGARVRASDESFTFYSIGAWGERKNMLGLLKAYLHTFTKEDRVRLVLIIDKVNFPVIHSLLARSSIPQSELPGLVVPDQRLSDDEILKLHRDGDCFVTATRSEGFGLPIFEAAVMGKPIIAPGWGGQEEFLEGYSNRRKVWHFLTPVFPGEDEVSIQGNQVLVKATLPRGATCKQLWAEPSLDRLSWEMKGAVLGFREGCLGDNHVRRGWFEENYSYDAIGKRFLNTLKEVLR